MAESISAEALNYLTMGIQAEISAYVFYKIGATKISEERQKQTLLHFAGEERKHFLTLERHYDQYVRSEKWVTYRDTMNREELPVIDESMGDKHVKRIDRVQKASRPWRFCKSHWNWRKKHMPFIPKRQRRRRRRT